jgi:hypothetical protein
LPIRSSQSCGATVESAVSSPARISPGRSRSRRRCPTRWWPTSCRRCSPVHWPDKISA